MKISFYRKLSTQWKNFKFSESFPALMDAPGVTLAARNRVRTTEDSKQRTEGATQEKVGCGQRSHSEADAITQERAAGLGDNVSGAQGRY
jgi:hypothetical protein